MLNIQGKTNGATDCSDNHDERRERRKKSEDSMAGVSSFPLIASVMFASMMLYSL